MFLSVINALHMIDLQQIISLKSLKRGWAAVHNNLGMAACTPNGARPNKLFLLLNNTYLRKARSDLHHAQASLRLCWRKGPSQSSWSILRSRAEYQRGVGSLQYLSDPTPTCYTDSDWAGRLTDRRRSVGGYILLDFISMTFVQVLCHSVVSIRHSTQHHNIFSC